jgi:hypothetical protein
MIKCVARILQSTPSRLICTVSNSHNVGAWFVDLGAYMSNTITRRELLTGAAALAAYSLLPRSAFAADPMPTSRLPVWGRWEGNVGVSGGIPSRTVQSGSTIAPYTGSASTINTAIANCPDDQYVQLGAGTFNLSSSITIGNNRMTLRGSVDSNGRPTTILNFTGGSSRLIGFEAAGWDLANTSHYTSVNVTGGVARGSTTLTLGSTPTSLVVGQVMLISAPPSAGVTPSGGNWSDLFGSRPFTQIVRVTAKSGNDVSFTPAINADYLSGTIQVHWRYLGASVKLSGIENLSLTRSGAGGHYVQFNGADECWAKNIKTYGVPSSTYHFYPYIAYRCEIRGCDVSHMDNLTNSTYCVNPAQSSQLLIEDNYFHDCPNVMPMFGLNGSAFSYNYVNDLPYSPSNWLSQIVFFHGSHNHYNLFEGNWCPASYNDDGCGSRNNVWFRNRMRGWDQNGPKTGNTEAITLCLNHSHVTMAGNVVGENGYHTAVATTFSGAGDNFPSNTIFNVNSACLFERVANYNTVNDAIPASEALAGGMTLPASYLYSSKPFWFGSLPWPWCDPFNYSQSNNFQNLPAGYRAANGAPPSGGGASPPAAPSNVHILTS